MLAKNPIDENNKHLPASEERNINAQQL